MSLILAFTILCGIYALGTFTGKITKGRVGSALISLIVMLFGFWMGIIPKDIVQVSQISAVYNICSAVIITNVAASIDLKQLKQYWKLSLTCVGGLVGLTIMVLLIGSPIFGKEFALASYPTLTGGAQATRLVSETLNANGAVTLAGLVVLLNSAQSWFGIPVITKGVRSECIRLLSLHRAGSINQEEVISVSHADSSKVPLIERIPKKYDSPWIHITLLAFVSYIGTLIASVTGPLTNNIVGNTLVCLLLGVVARKMGILVPNPLAKSGLFNFFMFACLIGLRANLANVSFDSFIANIVPMCVLILLGGIGLWLGGGILGKLFKIPKGITMAACFGAYLGYPLNYQLAEEIIESLAENAEEKALLQNNILNKVFIGSLVSVTILSLVIASIVCAYL